MTRLWIMSDLHLEGEHRLAEDERFRPKTLYSYDVAILAGDIHHSCRESVRWAADAFLHPVVMVAGNHEFYGGRLQTGLRLGQEAAVESGNWVKLLENDSYQVGDLQMLGCTLWSDFDLLPDRDRNMANADRGSQDFALITQFSPAMARDRHLESVQWLISELEKPHAGPTVVVTHHAPSRLSIPERFDNDPLSPAYASDLSWLIERYQPTLWVHGHVHDSLDYRIGKTRVVCNPRGFMSENFEFREDLVIDV